MPKQEFMLRLETFPLSEMNSPPEVTAAWMAEIVQRALEARACGAPAPLPFEVTVDGGQETALTTGQMRVAYPRGDFEEADLAIMWGE